MALDLDNVEYFPESVIALTREAYQHPELVHLLDTREDKSTRGGIATVAAYCGVVLEGVYTQQDLYTLADRLVTLLQAKRAGVVISNQIQ